MNTKSRHSPKIQTHCRATTPTWHRQRECISAAGWRYWKHLLVLFPHFFTASFPEFVISCSRKNSKVFCYQVFSAMFLIIFWSVFSGRFFKWCNNFMDPNLLHYNSQPEVIRFHWRQDSGMTLILTVKRVASNRMKISGKYLFYNQSSSVCQVVCLPRCADSHSSQW